ncbi:trichoplein keratin filament-binding protein isoform X2 [Entelurus aequoreus]|nr:trichoplein keratin filament-binding protein isoform X2 [Entelurus aequoreus]XP_061907256.1 trichoplein keratin filament-binding protein isoform X2 [Entelurus aequoreus]XP_061907257.1 trichoplein keratin filament-binding protein isoform X2 [Entelurus aequoreus]
MALPTLNAYIPHRKQSFGIRLAWKKEQQCRRQEKLDIYAKYFREQTFRNHLHHHWTSRESFDQSMSAYCRDRLEEENINCLEERRERLRHMLEEEQKQLNAELKELKVEKGQGISMERRKKLAQELLKEHWKRTKPVPQQQDVVEQEDTQNNYERTRREYVEQEDMQNNYERIRRESVEKIEQEEENRRAEEIQRAENLRKLMEELRLKEEEATCLRKEEESLQVQLWDVGKIEAERRKIEEGRKKDAMRNFLIRQYRFQLRRRAQQVQEELEVDLRLLAALLQGEQQQNEEVRAVTARRERVFADAAWMKRVIEEQLQLEREREAEFDFLHREEAQYVWEQREATWERERKAREMLMHEVLAERRKMLALKMQINRKAQLESLKKRDEMIRELEELKEFGRQDENQDNFQVEQQLEEQCRIEEEEKENRSAYLVHKEPLRKDQQWMRHAGYQPTIHSQPRIAWT